MSRDAAATDTIREIEWSLIGWLITSPKQSYAIEKVKPSHLGDVAMPAAYGAARRIMDETGDLAPAIFRDRIVAEGVVDYAKVTEWIRTAASLAPTSVVAAEQAADRIVSESILRQTKALGQEFAGIRREPFNRPSEIIDHIQSRVATIVNDDALYRIDSLEETLEADLRSMEERGRGTMTGLETGLIELDGFLSGLQNGEMIVLAARPSMGKSAMAGQIADTLAVDHQVPGVIFTLEMSRLAYLQRMICGRARADLHRRRQNNLRETEIVNYVREGKAIVKSPIRIVDKSSIHITEIRSMSRRLRDEIGIKWIVVDYLQLVRGFRRKGDSREQEVSSVSQHLKSLAQELNVPVIVVAQLNRAAMQRSDKTPQISDLRESGSIEQDADAILLLHREEFYHLNDKEWLDENPQKVGLAELIIGKQRNGPVGVVNLTWDGQHARFHNGTPAPQQQQSVFSPV